MLTVKSDYVRVYNFITTWAPKETTSLDIKQVYCEFDWGGLLIVLEHRNRHVEDIKMVSLIIFQAQHTDLRAMFSYNSFTNRNAVIFRILWN